MQGYRRALSRHMTNVTTRVLDSAGPLVALGRFASQGRGNHGNAKGCCYMGRDRLKQERGVRAVSLPSTRSKRRRGLTRLVLAGLIVAAVAASLATAAFAELPIRSDETYTVRVTAMADRVRSVVERARLPVVQLPHPAYVHFLESREVYDGAAWVAPSYRAMCLRITCYSALFRAPFDSRFAFRVWTSGGWSWTEWYVWRY
jgi:hypothetical protein